MKKALLFTWLLSVALIFSCKKQEIEISSNSPVELSNEELHSLSSNGFCTNGLEFDNDYVLVEGDGLIDRDYLRQLSDPNFASLHKTDPVPLFNEEGKVEERQIALEKQFMVSMSNVSSIPYFIAPSASSWTSEITTAFNNWVAIQGCVVNFTQTTSHSSARITIAFDTDPILPSKSRNLSGTKWAEACYPFNDQPGRFISINATPDAPFTTFAQRAALVTHEIGHTLGLRHTNETDPTTIFTQTDYDAATEVIDNCGSTVYGFNVLKGTPTSDPSSIMNDGNVTLNLGFSAGDIIAAQMMYPYVNTPFEITDIIPGEYYYSFGKRRRLFTVYYTLPATSAQSWNTMFYTKNCTDWPPASGSGAITTIPRTPLSGSFLLSATPDHTYEFQIFADNYRGDFSGFHNTVFTFEL